MIAGEARAKDYSASVKISLHIDGLTIVVAQIGGGRLWFEEPVRLPAGPGVVVLEIDGAAQRWNVTIDEMNEPAECVEAEFSSSV